MTRDACNTCVRTLEGERRLVVVETVTPHNRCHLMATLAVRRETRRTMVRCFRQLEIRPMTSDALRRCAGVLMICRVCMAGLAINASMCP